MKKEELMYGNKLLFLNEVVTFSHISQIREDGIFWIKTIEPKIDSKSFHFKPIPLTEEWLLKFGFTEEKQYYSSILSFFWLDAHKSLENSEFYIFFDTEVKSIGLHSMENENNISKYFYNIKFVHQLQNLYFALTGTHLKLK